MTVNYAKFLILLIFSCVLACSPVLIESTKASEDENIIIITCAGDVTVGTKNNEEHERTMKYFLDQNNNDYSLIFKNLYEVTSQDTLTIVNLETTFTETDGGQQDKTYVFKAPYDYVNILHEGSIEAVTIANNHANDYLEQGRNDNIRTLYDNDIIISGEEYAGSYEVNGVTIGLLGYTVFHTKFNFNKAIERDIQYMRKMYDIVIVNFHWGHEKEYYADRGQTQLGQKAIDLGADLVVGHHPHVINGIECYKGKYIVYSMGNCAFAGSAHPYNHDIILFQQRFIIDEDGKVRPYGVKVIPGSVSSHSSYNDYMPTVAKDDEAERILEKVLKLSGRLKYGIKEISDSWIMPPETDE